jgi:dihydroorotate dehydrogenase electron transfer subunit
MEGGCSGMVNLSTESNGKKHYNVYHIAKKSIREITENTYLITFDEDISFLPGQFCMINVDGAGLTRKPFTLGRINNRELAISIKISGKGSDYIVKINNKLNVLAPLGKSFLPQNQNGAILVAPSCLAEGIHLSQHFNAPLFVASKTEFNKEIIDEFQINLTLGNDGYLRLLRDLNEANFDWIFVSGSKVMEELAVRNMPNKVVYVSLNEYMACGIGACKGCAVETSHGIKHVCTDGPVFRGDEIWQVQRY